MPRPASPPCRGRYTPTHGWGPDATRLDTTMLILTGSRERTESEHQDLLHRAGLTLIKTAPTASPLSIFRPHLPKTDSASGFPERNCPGPAALDCRSPYAGRLAARSLARTASSATSMWRR
jgi:hypothetical protein